MDIKASPYLHPDLPIHRVAAKHQIKELENGPLSGNNFQKYFIIFSSTHIIVPLQSSNLCVFCIIN